MEAPRVLEAPPVEESGEKQPVDGRTSGGGSAAAAEEEDGQEAGDSSSHGERQQHQQGGEGEDTTGKARGEAQGNGKKKLRTNPPRNVPSERVLNSAREESPEEQEDAMERIRIKNLKGLVTRAVYDRYNRSRNLLALCDIPVGLFPFPPEFFAGAEMPNETLEVLLNLTRSNMKQLYDSTLGWSWSDTTKRGELRNERMRWIVVWTDESRTDVAGFTAFRLSADSGVAHLYLHELQVAPAWRQRGLGSALMQLVETVATKSHISLIMLTVLSNNQAARRFYSRLKFQVDEASPGPCYNLGHDGPYSIMSKVLDDACLRHRCTQCTFRCRYSDTLEQHQGYHHGRPWAFPCPVEGCGRGTVLAAQIQKHVEIAHGWATASPAPTHLHEPQQQQQQQQQPEASKNDGETASTTDSRGAELLNDRVTFKADGHKGTVTKIHNGFFTVRLDGPVNQSIVCRVSAFEGYEAIERVKKEVDPDYEYALKLQLEDGWARRSTRVKRQ